MPPRPAGVAQAEDKPRATLAYEGSRPRPPQFYDLDSPSYRVLQKASDALAGFPRDADNQTDWMRALGRKLIRPRADLRGKGTMQLLDTNIIMTNTKDMAHVRFPHRSHTEWLACQNCHDEIFVAKRGANRITMNDILLGKYCGVCHDKVAFSSYVCDRCHSVTNPARTK